jgi:hypothetical protein
VEQATVAVVAHIATVVVLLLAQAANNYQRKYSYVCALHTVAGMSRIAVADKSDKWRNYLLRKRVHMFAHIVARRRNNHWRNPLHHNIRHSCRHTLPLRRMVMHIHLLHNLRVQLYPTIQI